MFQIEAAARMTGSGPREQHLAALALRSLGPPQPPGAPGTLSEWARAAVSASAAVLGLPPPPGSVPQDIERALSLAPHLKGWAFSPKGGCASASGAGVHAGMTGE